jgi:hypothetical protein
MIYKFLLIKGPSYDIQIPSYHIKVPSYDIPVSSYQDIPLPSYHIPIASPYRFITFTSILLHFLSRFDCTCRAVFSTLCILVFNYSKNNLLWRPHGDHRQNNISPRNFTLHHQYWSHLPTSVQISTSHFHPILLRTHIPTKLVSSNWFRET